MKKLMGVLVASVMVAMGLGGQVAHAGVNDFTITDYEINYQLGKDEQGRSVLNTVEVITAEFPQYDQNHGIERAIPNTYQGHSTSLQIDGVYDGRSPNAKPLNYTTYESGGNTVVRIGDADTYVHGTRSYQIAYTQRDVTAYFANSNDDEFYWDTNGVDWRVPIQNLTVSVTVRDGLTSSLTGQTACYQGAQGVGDACALKDEGGVFTATAQNLAPGENVTIALGFAPQTFAAYEQSLGERLFMYWLIAVGISIPVSIVLFVMLVARWYRANNRSKDVTTVVPEYLPPKDASVTLSAHVVNATNKAMTAQIIDLAVRHYLKIYQTREKSFWKKAEYELEIAKPITDLKWEEAELVRDLFSNKTEVGSRMKMSSLSKSTAFYSRISNNEGDLKKRIRGEYDVRAKDEARSKSFKKIGVILLLFGLVLPPFIIVGIVSFVLGMMLWPLTDKGVELRRYLLGLKDYISVAENERLRMLQSPEGAAKVGAVNVSDTAQLVKLYERVLPYAVLFGIEKEWNKQLGVYYETANVQPDWYVGRAAFNAAVFTTAMSSFTSSVAYAQPSSSSSGGSGGGGFSGGGGGGGGGGGW